jgi:hypothetical protein
MDRSELVAGSAGNAAGRELPGCQASHVVTGRGRQFGTWLTEQFRGLDASLPVCSLATSMPGGTINRGRAHVLHHPRASEASASTSRHIRAREPAQLDCVAVRRVLDAETAQSYARP